MDTGSSRGIEVTGEVLFMKKCFKNILFHILTAIFYLA